MVRTGRQRLVAGIAAIAVTAAVGGGVATQGAQAGGDLCSVDQVCIFNQPDFIGELGWLGPGQGVTEVGHNANDETQSWQNRTDEDARWYVNAYGGGPCYDMPHNTGHATMTYPDELSSWATNGGC